MIAFLARSSFGRVVLALVVIVAGAWSWLADNLLAWHPSRSEMQRACWGWLSPAMTPHWQRVADGNESLFHVLKNVGTEWARLDSERVYKAGCFVLVGAVVTAFACGVLITGWFF